MIHTLNLYFETDTDNIIIPNSEIYDEIRGVRIDFFKPIGRKLPCRLTVNLTNLLGKREILQGDYDLIIRKIDTFLNNHLPKLETTLVLTRIDYKFDVLIENEKVRKTILIMLNKLTNKYRFFKKYNKYSHGIYYKNKSMRINIYDREKYGQDKKPSQIIEPVLRYEIQILNLHLNYNKFNRGIKKELEVYFKQSMRKRYFIKILKPIIYAGDYYSQYHANKIINSSTRLSEKDKQKLKFFLVRVSKGNIDSAKNDLSPFTFRKIITNLEKLNINPVLIPSTARHKHIKNYIQELW